MTAQIERSRRHVSLDAPPPTHLKFCAYCHHIRTMRHDGASARPRRGPSQLPSQPCRPLTSVQSSANPFACDRVKCSQSRARFPSFLGATRELGANWWLKLLVSPFIPSHLHPRTRNHPSRRGSQGGSPVRLSATQTGKTIPKRPTTAAARIQEPREACELPPSLPSSEAQRNCQL